jgi:hypothetical protein
MRKLSNHLTNRITKALNRYRRIIDKAKRADANEANTSSIVQSMLTDIFGYKKFGEITSEYEIRGTYCDLAVQVDGDLRFLVEIKAANIELKKRHADQIIRYGAREKLEWAILTNATRWQAYRIVPGPSPDGKLVLDVDVLALRPTCPDVIEFFGNLSREKFRQSSMAQLESKKRAMGKFTIAALLRSDPVLKIISKEIRKLVRGFNPDTGEIRKLIEKQVIKQELMEGSEAELAVKLAKKAGRTAKKTAKGKSRRAPRREKSTMRSRVDATEAIRPSSPSETAID